MMTKLKAITKNKNYITYLIIALVALIVSVLFCRYHADKLLIDDLLSFSLSNTPGGWVSHESLGYIDPSVFNRFAVIDNPFDYANVWVNQANDCHPILYYSIIHTICSIFQGKMSLWFGYLPNIVCYIINALVLYKLSNKITDSFVVSIGISILYIVNPVILDHVAFIRMYTMVSMWVLLFASGLYEFYTNDSLSKKNYLYMFIITTCGCLTHYYCYVAFFFMSAFLCFHYLFKKQYSLLIKFAISILLGVGLAICIFPSAINHFLTDQHSVNAVSNLENQSDAISRWLQQLSTSPLGYASAILVVLVVVGLIIKRKVIDDKIKYLITVLITSILYFLLVGKTSSFISARYIIPIGAIFIFTSICLLFLLLKTFIDTKVELSIAVAMAVLLIVSGFPTLYVNNYKNPITYAKQHPNDLVIVYSLESFDPNYTNIDAFELREYSKVYLTDNSEAASNLKDEFYFDEEAIVYIVKDDGSGNKVDMYDKAVNWIQWRSRFTTFEYTGYSTSLYDIYYAK